MNVRQKRSLTGNLETLVRDGALADDLVVELIEQLKQAKSNQESQSKLTGLAHQLLVELER